MNEDEERNLLIEKIKQVSNEIGSRHVPRKEFLRRAKVSGHRIDLLFGSHNGLAEAAGLETHQFPRADSPGYTDSELLQEVVRVIRLPGSNLTRTFFQGEAHVPSSVCETHFDGWIGTLRRAAELLDPERDRELLSRVEEYANAPGKTDDELLQEVVRVLRLPESKMTRIFFERAVGVSPAVWEKRFGGWIGTLRRAAELLDPERDRELLSRVEEYANPPEHTDDELLQDVVRVLRSPESKMTRIFFERAAGVSPRVWERRFGGWIGTLRRAVTLLDPERDRELLRRVREYTAVNADPAHSDEPKQAAPKPQTAPMDPRPADQHMQETRTPVQSNPPKSVFGDFINFRGLQHAPVNEQGVVFLFGMVCKELGYVVEIVRQGFPDCEAKRRISENPPRWQRVRIEFEYLSNSFKGHGHDPDQCDLIVCWQNNWKNCPLEVLELSSSIGSLPAHV